MATVRLPLTSRRRAEHTFVRLIERIRLHNMHPMSIEGPTFKCGTLVDARQLRPAEHFPRVPLLLEWAGIATPGWGHRHSTHLHILWKYDDKRGELTEVIRVVALGNEWLEPIRTAALREMSDPEATSAQTGASASERVKAAIEKELEYLNYEAQAHFVARLYDEISGRLAHLD